MNYIKRLKLAALTILAIPALASAQADGDLRMVDSPNERSGRLEVFHSGQWGTVCDDFFNDTDAGVACRQMGWDDGVRANFLQFPEGTGTIWMDNLMCTGTESSLVDCPFNGFGSHNCIHIEDVGIHCSGCPATASGSCTGGFGAASLSISEKNVGSEKLTAKFTKGPALTYSDLGSPLSFPEASYSLCIYDDAGNLAGTTSVRGTFDLCGTKSCWKSTGKSTDPTGYLYKDKATGEDGILAMTLKAGDAGKSKIVIKGKNRANLVLQNLPSIAPALAGSTSATMQLHTDEAGCFTANLGTVLKNDGTLFKAKQ